MLLSLSFSLKYSLLIPIHIAYPSSHPVVKLVDSVQEIEQLVDGVESAKVASILRMVESEIGEIAMWNAIGVINLTF